MFECARVCVMAASHAAAGFGLGCSPLGFGRSTLARFYCQILTSGTAQQLQAVPWRSSRPTVRTVAPHSHSVLAIAYAPRAAAARRTTRCIRVSLRHTGTLRILTWIMRASCSLNGMFTHIVAAIRPAAARIGLRGGATDICGREPVGVALLKTIFDARHEQAASDPLAAWRALVMRVQEVMRGCFLLFMLCFFFSSHQSCKFRSHLVVLLHVEHTRALSWLAY